MQKIKEPYFVEYNLIYIVDVNVMKIMRNKILLKGCWIEYNSVIKVLTYDNPHHNEQSKTKYKSRYLWSEYDEN